MVELDFPRREAGAALKTWDWHGVAVAVAVCAVFFAVPALASGTGMPWESALTTIQNSLTGPVALVVAILGVVVCGAMLVFGGDMQEFTRRMIYVVMAIAVLVSAAGVIRLFFPSAGGAVI